VLVALGLDDDLATEDRTGIVGNAVDSSVARGLGQAGLQAHLLEQVGDQILELSWRELHQVGALVDRREDVGLLHEPRVDDVELEDWTDR